MSGPLSHRRLLAEKVLAATVMFLATAARLTGHSHARMDVFSRHGELAQISSMVLPVEIVTHGRPVSKLRHHTGYHVWQQEYVFSRLCLILI
jgi:hypothetical protein